jgi:hypothetical protein
MQMHKVQQ